MYITSFVLSLWCQLPLIIRLELTRCINSTALFMAGMTDLEHWLATGSVLDGGANQGPQDQ